MSQPYRRGSSIMWTAQFVHSQEFLDFIELIPEAVIISNSEGKVIITNHLAQKLFQYNKTEFTQCVIEDLAPQNIREIHVKMRKWFFQNPKPRYLAGRGLQLFAHKKDGSLFPMESALFAIHTDQGPLAVNLLRDTSSQKRKEQEVIKYAFIDSLTNLPNRRYFDSHMKSTAARIKRHHEVIGLMFIDLDGFKAINDQYGHEVGDSILKELGPRLSAVVREEDFLARIGGDEFILTIFPACNEEYLKIVAERILETCRKPFIAGENRFQLSASIGICANNPKSKFDEKALTHIADKAMYKAKQQGGNQFECAFNR